MSGVVHLSTPHSYSSAVIAGDFVFLGLHRGGGDGFAAQFDDAMRGLRRTLAECGLGLSALVKVNVWLMDISDLPEMERRFRDWFEVDRFPARMTATTQFVDGDCLLMIDGVAYRGE